MANTNFYQDLFQLGGQVQGNIQPQVDWMWGNQNMPTNPFATNEQQYNVLRSGSEPDAEYAKKYQELITKGYSPEEARKLVAWENDNIQKPIYEPDAKDLWSPEKEQEVDRQNAEWIDQNLLKPNNGVAPWAGEEDNNQMNSQLFMNSLPFMTSTGTDIGTELFMAGNALGASKGTPGRGLAIASGIGAAVMGGARAGLSGYSLAKANETQAEWQRKQLAKGRQGSYTPAPQYGNTNNIGGFMGEDGGTYSKLFADGGTSNPPDGAPISTPFNINDRGTWTGYYGDFPTTGKLTDPLPPTGSPEWENNFNTWGEYITAREGELKDPTLTTPAVGMRRHITRPTGIPPYSSVPTTETQGYLVIDQKGGTPRRVSETDYRKFTGKKTIMPIDSRGNLVNPSTGGVTFTNYSNYKQFQEGGEMMQEQEQQMPQEGQEEQMMQQVAGMAQQMLEQGASPEEVMQALVSQGVPQEVAQQVIQMLMQQGQQQMPPQMQYGGLFQETNSDPIVKFNKNVGDVVEFEANGKTHKGKIKKIENGKFFI